MPTVLADPIPLHVQTDGDDRRPPLLLINPLGTTLEFWDPLIEPLAERFWVIRYDLRGHGGSTGVCERYTVADAAGDALAVLDALEVGRAHIVGSSFGGLVAAYLAGTRPDRVQRLVLSGTSLRLGRDEWWEETARRITEGGMAAVVDHLDELFFSEAWKLAVPDRREAARAMLLATAPDAYLAGISAVLDCELEDTVRQIRAATLVIAGEQDPMFRHEPVTDLLAMIPDSEAVHVGGAMHRVLLEQPDALAGVIVEFLTDPDGR